MGNHRTSDVAASPREPVARAAHTPLRWVALPLFALAVLLANLPFDLGPSLLRNGQPGAGSSAVGPIYWATHIGYGVLLGVLWVIADRVLRGRLRPLGWALALGLGALLFSPDGVVYFANAFAFGADLALQGLRALWPMAVGSAFLGYWLGWAAVHARVRTAALVLTGLIVGVAGHILCGALTPISILDRFSGPVPMFGFVATGLPRAGLEGALLGLAVGLALRQVSGLEARPTDNLGGIS